jgi:Tfp pilus assembly protein PilE
MTSKGITVVELLITLVVMGIIGVFAIVNIVNVVQNAKRNIDKNTVYTLNKATNYYALDEDIIVFNDASITDVERINTLYETGYTSRLIETQSKNASFVYSPENRLWSLVVNGETVLLTPFGNTQEEIIPTMITTITDAIDAGSPPRSWGDYRYTDLGLDPDDWDDPVDHLYYTPSGTSLRISPEENYTITIDYVNGGSDTLTSNLNWDIVYDATTDKWYFHSINPGNEVIYETLTVTPS